MADVLLRAIGFIEKFETAEYHDQNCFFQNDRGCRIFILVERGRAERERH